MPVELVLRGQEGTRGAGEVTRGSKKGEGVQGDREGGHWSRPGIG